MINLFQASANDQSLTYLYAIFGSMNGIIPISGTQASSGTVITLLGTMFKTFNSVILAVGALIVVYVTVVGVMNTAHEGQVMGKEWNNLWVPIRIVMGIAAMVPTGSGYSGIQIIMMWVILQGIGAADTLWGTALAYISVTGSPYATITPPPGQARQSLKDLFSGMVCYKAAAATFPNIYPAHGPDNSYYCSPENKNVNFCSTLNSASFAPTFSDNTPYEMGPGGVCGILSFCDQAKSCAANAANPNDTTVGPNSLSCLACKAQITALTAIVPTLAGIADLYINTDYEYTKFFFGSPTGNQPAKAPAFVQSYCSAKGITNCTPAALPSPLGDAMSAPSTVIDSIYWTYGIVPEIGSKDFMSTMLKQYQDGIGAALQTYMLTMQNNPSSPLTGMLQGAQDSGWILAGSYYLMLARSNSSNLQAAMPNFKVSFVADSLPTTNNSPLYKYRNDYKASQRLISLASGSAQSGGDSASAPVTGSMGDASGDAGSSMNSLVNSSGTDPLTQLSQAGYELIMVASILTLLFLVLVPIISAITHITFLVLGSGMPDNPVGEGIQAALFLILPIFFMLVGIMFSVGATLAIYVPLIPYTIFTIGAIGWMISTIEAMVAGPLVALGILAPGGHHQVLGKAEPALLLLFNIFLRPSLMIFGMFAAMLLSAVVLKMINTGFATVFMTLFDYSNSAAKGGATVGGTAVGNAVNPVALVFVLVFYVTLITTALNKTFGAIHVIPEKVIRWIGGQGESYGEAEALGEVKGAISGAADKAGRAAQTLGEIKHQKAKNAKENKGGGASVGKTD